MDFRGREINRTTPMQKTCEMIYSFLFHSVITVAQLPAGRTLTRLPNATNAIRGHCFDAFFSDGVKRMVRFCGCMLSSMSQTTFVQTGVLPGSRFAYRPRLPHSLGLAHATISTHRCIPTNSCPRSFRDQSFLEIARQARR